MSSQSNRAYSASIVPRTTFNGRSKITNNGPLTFPLIKRFTLAIRFHSNGSLIFNSLQLCRVHKLPRLAIILISPLITLCIEVYISCFKPYSSLP